MGFMDIIKARGGNQSSGKTAKDRLMNSKINSDGSEKISELKKLVYAKLSEINSLNSDNIVITSNDKDINVNIVNIN